MNVVNGAVRAVTRTADATTAAAGAVSGAAINGAVGALRGTAAGVRDGVGKGSHSTAAAALTLGAVGAAGLVEWPILLAVGGSALLVHQLSHRSNGDREPAPLRSVPTATDSAGSGSSGTTSTSASKPRKTTRARRSTSQ
ncbi:hypothetical protein E4P42_25995 [Mycobacterium sp. PS03-16]|uniref:hypothetical protein n=1 Tax=Mycobacterium sp. PS03-16 TaxID=2559611 RepID=UPI001073B1CC|nr:hypothetical protein [Mycobacterium sp. PS03-16]TFV54414.1 hypothetical protein E4P42_25995 [Mycobacterium sp. PS03-16]